MGVTIEEWLAEMERLGLSGTDADGITIAEIAEASGISRETLRVRMRAAIEAGLAEYAGKRTMASIDGRPTAVPVYRLMGGEQ